MLEQDLIEAALVIKRAQCGFETLHSIVSSGMVEALVVDAADLQDCAEVAGFGEERVLVPEPEQV